MRVGSITREVAPPPGVRVVNPLEPLGDVLVRCQVLTADQWAAARDGADDAGLARVLDHLQQTPAWWSPDGDQPALSAYQRKKAERHYGDGRFGQLERSLRVKDYLVLEPVGQGGMGLVYRGWDLAKSRPVALKRVLTDSAQARRRFKREGRLLERLDHPAVARFYELVPNQQRVLLVLEWINGRDLVGEVESRGKIPWREVAGWAGDLLDALEHVHRRQVIHRDIKPANVMVHRPPGGGRAVPKLLDLGLAKCTDEAVGASTRGSTEGNVRLGTYIYMPPEQWRGAAHVSPASDVYTLGGTLFYALAGRPPFEADSAPGYCYAHAQKAPPSLRALRPDVPAALDDLIRRMLSKDPAQRGTPARLRAEVRQLLRTTARATPRPGQVTAVKARPSDVATRVTPVVPITPITSPSLLAPPEPPRKPRPAGASSTLLPRQRAASTARSEPAGGDESAAPLGTSTAELIDSAVRYVSAPRAGGESVLARSSGDDLSRKWHQFLLSLSAWVVSLGRPREHPGRWAVVIVLAVMLAKLLSFW